MSSTHCVPIRLRCVKCLFKDVFSYLTGDVKEIRIIGGHLGPNCWPTAIDMVAKNRLPLEDIITHKFPLKEFDQGIKMVVNSEKSIKVMLYHTNGTQ